MKGKSISRKGSDGLVVFSFSKSCKSVCSDLGWGQWDGLLNFGEVDYRKDSVAPDMSGTCLSRDVYRGNTAMNI